MEKLIEGYRKFRRTAWPAVQPALQVLVEQGQQPRAMVICCADSRFDPWMIFSASPGELFVVRNIANVVPPYAPDSAYHGTSAALEFAVRVLGVRDLVVMGHGQCGGVRALLDGAPPEASDFVAPWMRIADRARSRVLSCTDPVERQFRGECETIKLSLDNLLTFPWIADRVAAGSLRLHGTHLDLASGVLRLLDGNDAFAVISADD
jgi:carbonic anhydrase